MNLYLAFLGEIFAIFHRRYLSFFVIFKKSLLKKYVLKGKEKMASSRSPPHKKIFILLLLLTITFKYELKYVVLSPKSVVFANLIIYPSLSLRTRRISTAFASVHSAVSLPATGHPLLSCSGVNPAKKTLIDRFFLVAIPFSLVKSVFFEKAMLAAA